MPKRRKTHTSVLDSGTPPVPTLFAIDAVDTRVVKLHNFFDPGCVLEAFRGIFTDLAGGAAQFTWYLHATDPNNADGGIATVTFKKYTHPATHAIIIDVTDVTKGLSFIDQDRWPLDEIPNYGLCGELHVILNAGTAKMAPFVSTSTEI